MPNLLAICSEANEVTSPDDPEPIDPTAPDNANDNSSPSDKQTPCNIPECDNSKQVHEDEVSLFVNTQKNIDEAPDEEEEEEPVNVTDCGKCDYIKEENKYSQAYFEKEYGELYCCNKECKNATKTMREFIDTRSDKCFWVCKNCKRRDNDTHGCTKMYCNACFFSKEESNNSGRNSRARRTRSL